jgi:hypothetical protein
MPMESTHPRIIRERVTLERMIELYCKDHHTQSAGALCPTCQELSVYALDRLRRCPFQPHKPTCAKCSVHCYKPAMRERVRVVMRYAGPRMVLKHPILAAQHLLDGFRKPKK